MIFHLLSYDRFKLLEYDIQKISGKLLVSRYIADVFSFVDYFVSIAPNFVR